MKSAYYNEIDDYAARWLRNLIAAGLIPDGDVDERDIRDVRPDDLRGYRQAHFFAGCGGGRSRSASPVGRTIAPCGAAVAHANLSPRQAEDAGLLTSGTSGARGSGTSSSAALQSSLANKYREQSTSVGSMKWPMTWSAKVTPSGRSYCRLALSKRRKSASDFGLWPAPTASRRSGLQSHGRNAILGPLNPQFLALAHGIPEQPSIRRALGNAVVPAAAAQFIMMTLEVLHERSKEAA